MSDKDYYPAGAYKDTNAPYNQSDIPEEDFEITCSQSLSKTVTVTTNDYIPGAEDVDYDVDEDGCHAIYYKEDPDTSDTNWEEAYNKEHYTPKKLLELFKEFLETYIPDPIVNIKEYKRYKHLIKECSDWCSDELSFME